MRFSAERARFSAEQAHVNISYKTAADRLELAAPYNRISDWLFLNANDGSNRRTKFLDGFKNMKAAHRQQ